MNQQVKNTLAALRRGQQVTVIYDPSLCQKIIDSILPLLQGTAAPLENQSVMILYPAKLVSGNWGNTHRDCTSRKSRWI